MWPQRLCHGHSKILNFPFLIARLPYLITSLYLVVVHWALLVIVDDSHCVCRGYLVQGLTASGTRDVTHTMDATRTRCHHTKRRSSRTLTAWTNLEIPRHLASGCSFRSVRDTST
jgi:hypothetical protein